MNTGGFSAKINPEKLDSDSGKQSKLQRTGI
jgi:hypothetical protein